MRIGQYIEVLRAHRVFVAVSVLACAAGAALLAWTVTPMYAANTQLYVSTKGIPGATGAFERGLYAQQRARTYAEILNSETAAKTVVAKLGLAEDVETVEDKISATVPLNGVVINVTVTDRSPELAQAIAASFEDRLPRLTDRLETRGGTQVNPLSVTVTEPAQLPLDPVSPVKPVYLALGALFGLCFGIAGAVLRHTFDRRIRVDADAIVAAGAPVLGRIAEHPHQSSPVILGDPRSAAAEGFYGLRANLRAFGAAHDLRSFVVSSALPAEGKTEVVANLGVALARAGERVTLVDANLRSPRLAELLGIRSSNGLTDLLEGNQPIAQVLRRHPTEPLGVITSGSPKPNPSELLESGVLDSVLDVLSYWFEFVIVDAPALLPVADASVLARHAAGVVLVTDSGSTTTDQLRAARQAVRDVDARMVGVVLNRVRERDVRLYREDPLPPPRGRSRTLASIRSGAPESAG